MFLLPRRWKRQPVGPVEINWNDDATQDLLFCWTGADLLDLVSGDELTIGGGLAPSECALDEPINGLAPDFVAASSQYLQLPSGLTTSTALTFAAHVRYEQSLAFHAVFALTASASDTGYRILMNGSTNVAMMQTLGSGSGTANSTNTIASGAQAHIAAIQRTMADRSVYLNRVRTDNTTNAGTAPTPVRFTIGMYRGATPLYPWGGHIAAVCVWGAAKDDALIEAHDEAPYFFLRSTGRRTYFDVPAAGGTGVLSQSIGDITLASAGALQIKGSASQSIGAITLASTGTLRLLGILDVTIGAITLSSTGAVQIKGTLGPSSIGDIAIAATGSLTQAGSGSLAQPIGDITLTATGVLPIAGTASMNIGAVTLSADGALLIKGTLAQPIGDIGLSAQGAGAQVITGALAQSIGTITLGATGALALRGALAQSIGAISIFATGQSGVVVMYVDEDYRARPRARSFTATTRRRSFVAG